MSNIAQIVQWVDLLMGEAKVGAAYYRALAGMMGKLAVKAHAQAQCAAFLRLEASWTRLAEAAEKLEGAPSSSEEVSSPSEIPEDKLLRG
jgi:hypothetical protein